MTNTRIMLLDLYRFIAATAVLIYHYFGATTEPLRHNLVYGNIYTYPLWDEYVHFGTIGVDLFFLISGFVIALSAENRSFSEYISSRFSRILPTYWLCILLTSLFLIIEGSGYREITLKQIFANLILMQRPLHQEFIDMVYWTIAIEFRFYLMVGLFIYFRVFKYYHYFLPVWVIFASFELIGIPLGPIKQILITSYAYYFVAGGCFYYWYQGRYLKIILPTLIISLVIAIITGYQHFAEFGTRDAVTAACLITICFLLMSMVSLKVGSEIKGGFIATLGAVTYPLYLIHEDIGFVLMRHISFTQNGAVIILFIALLMFFTALAINKYFEAFAVRWSRQELRKILTKFD